MLWPFSSSIQCRIRTWADHEVGASWFFRLIQNQHAHHVDTSAGREDKQLSVVESYISRKVEGVCTGAPIHALQEVNCRYMRPLICDTRKYLVVPCKGDLVTVRIEPYAEVQHIRAMSMCPDRCSVAVFQLMTTEKAERTEWLDTESYGQKLHIMLGIQT